MTRNNTENCFRTSYALCSFVLFIFKNASQTIPPQGVQSTKLREMDKNWRIISLGHLNASLCAQSPCPATFPFNTEEEKGKIQQYHSHSLQISVFSFHGEIPSLPQRSCLISSLGSTAQFTRRAICLTMSSFNLIIIAAPVATLPCIPILFIPCQASLISDHDVLLSQVLPAPPQLLYIPSKSTLTSYPATEIEVSHLLSSFWPLTFCNS